MWVRKKGFYPPNSDRPRKLTSEEIDDMISILPPLQGADEITVQTVMESISHWFRTVIAELQLSESCIRIAKVELKRQQGIAIIVPNTPVGVPAAEAFVATLQQTVLKTFHFAGTTSQSVGFGVSVTKELINASKKRKREFCILYFNDQDSLTFSEALERKIDIVEKKVSDLFDSRFQIGFLDEFKIHWWNTKKGMNLFRGEKTNAKTMVRFEFDIDVLYQYRITIADIAKMIRIAGTNVCEGNIIPVLHGSTEEKIIDVYPPSFEVLKRALVSANFGSIINSNLMTQEVLEVLFLERILTKYISDTVVSGIPGFKEFTPIGVPLKDLIVFEKKLDSNDALFNKFRDELENTKLEGKLNIWQLILKHKELRRNGITLQHFKTMFEDSELRDRLRFITMISPDIILIVAPASPKEILSNLLLKHKKFQIENAEFIEPRGIVRKSRYYYGEAQGTDLVALQKLSYTDPLRSISYNLHNACNILGVEAARKIYAREVALTIKQSSGGISPVHIELYADVVCIKGFPNGATYAGFAKQKPGVFELALIMKPLDVFLKAAISGGTELATGAIGAAAFGTPFNIGTGAVRVGVSIVEDNERRDLIDEQIPQYLRNKLVDVTKFQNSPFSGSSITDGIAMLRQYGIRDITEEVVPEFDEDTIEHVTIKSSEFSTLTSVPPPVIEGPPGKSEVLLPAPVISKAFVEIANLGIMRENAMKPQIFPLITQITEPKRSATEIPANKLPAILPHLQSVKEAILTSIYEHEIKQDVIQNSDNTETLVRYYTDRSKKNITVDIEKIPSSIVITTVNPVILTPLTMLNPVDYQNILSLRIRLSNLMASHSMK